MKVLLVGWRPEAVAALRAHGAEVTCALAAADDLARAGLLDDAHTVVVEDAADAESTLAGLHRAGTPPTAFDVVCSQFEFTMVTAAVLGGSRCPQTPEQALLLRDKDLQKRRVREAGLPVADCRVLTRASEVGDVGYPRGVIKPLADSSTRGVRHWQSPQQRRALADELGALPGPWLAEAWVDGSELHLDGVVRGGEVRFLSVGRYLQNVLAIRDGGLVGTVVQHPRAYPELQHACLKFADRAMTALDHRDGVFHLELFEDGDRLVFGECGGRIGGGSWDEMIRRQHGVDLHDEWARAVLGLPGAAAPVVSDRWYGDLFLDTPPGELVSCPDVAALLARPGVEHAVVLAEPGAVLADRATASSACAGFAVVSGSGPEQTADRIRELARWFSDESVLR
ncbi:hypothetical protein [Actinokineospora sp. NBRC 105648]|uniref:hypothetical protein n=1 Tax=Actinokineospora sp. NBRC 105648 TaxID=3032206 RepID=UPI00249FAE9B|nr:hypothetical protein [Actinokineospora sp. NBRC 105648]GLZ38107.1 hypothetical protein Acsp05_17310 [Actinokineospora sp. NBRC 105648]